MNDPETTEKRKSQRPDRSDTTRLALIQAATRVFARDGFHAASTRTLALEAGVNQALISYHFGNKEGLYLAVFSHMTMQLQDRTADTVSRISQAMDTVVNRHDALTTAAIQELCRENIICLLDAHIHLLVEQGFEDYAKLITREQLEPTAAFDVLWEGTLSPTLALLTQLISLNRGRQNAQDDDRITALALVGQILVFRVARATCSRQLDWPDRYTNDQIGAIKAVVRSNVERILY